MMSIQEYKNWLKNLVESTNDKELLMQWKEQLEWDLQHKGEADLSAEEWSMVQEGLADYKAANVLSLEEYLKKR